MARTVDTINLSIERYENYKHELALYSDTEYSVPANTTNYTAEMEFRDKPGGTLLFLATTGNGYLSVGQSSVTIEIPSAIIGAWTFTAAQYDLFVISPVGKPKKVAKGSVVIYPSVTQL